MGRGEPAWSEALFSPRLYLYTGGLLGVAVVWLSNVTVSKRPAFTLSLLLFVGQEYAGIDIDTLLEQDVSARILIGGFMVAAGLVANLLHESCQKKLRQSK